MFLLKLHYCLVWVHFQAYENSNVAVWLGLLCNSISTTSSLNKRGPLSKPVCDILRILPSLIYSHLPHISVSACILICEPVPIKRKNNQIENKSRALNLSNDILTSYFYCSPVWQSELCDGRPAGPSLDSEPTWMICSCSGPSDDASVSSWGGFSVHQQALVIYNTGTSEARTRSSNLVRRSFHHAFTNENMSSSFNYVPFIVGIMHTLHPLWYLTSTNKPWWVQTTFLQWCKVMKIQPPQPI